MFYSFKLQASELIYLSVLDKPDAGKAVPVTLELYGACPGAAGGNAIACDPGAQGQGTCRGSPFPLITSSNTGVLAGKPQGPGTFFVAVRAPQGPGSWTLTFHHVPMQCVAQGELVPTTQMVFLAATPVAPRVAATETTARQPRACRAEWHSTIPTWSTSARTSW